MIRAVVDIDGTFCAPAMTHHGRTTGTSVDPDDKRHLHIHGASIAMEGEAGRSHHKPFRVAA